MSVQRAIQNRRRDKLSQLILAGKKNGAEQVLDASLRAQAYPILLYAPREASTAAYKALSACWASPDHDTTEARKKANADLAKQLGRDVPRSTSSFTQRELDNGALTQLETLLTDHFQDNPSKSYGYVQGFHAIAANVLRATESTDVAQRTFDRLLPLYLLDVAVDLSHAMTWCTLIFMLAALWTSGARATPSLSAHSSSSASASTHAVRTALTFSLQQRLIEPTSVLSWPLTLMGQARQHSEAHQAAIPLLLDGILAGGASFFLYLSAILLVHALQHTPIKDLDHNYIKDYPALYSDRPDANWHTLFQEADALQGAWPIDQVLLMASVHDPALPSTALWSTLLGLPEHQIRPVTVPTWSVLLRKDKTVTMKDITARIEHASSHLKAMHEPKIGPDEVEVVRQAFAPPSHLKTGLLSINAVLQDRLTRPASSPDVVRTAAALLAVAFLYQVFIEYRSLLF